MWRSKILSPVEANIFRRRFERYVAHNRPDDAALAVRAAGENIEIAVLGAGKTLQIAETYSAGGWAKLDNLDADWQILVSVRDPATLS